MIKTNFGSIVSHKFKNEYICYDSSIQPILKERIITSLESDEFRLSNTSNFLDLNNGLIKKHFYRKGAMYLLHDNYLYYGLGNTRPINELKNYIDFTYIVANSSNKKITNTIELCTPLFCYVKKNMFYYKGDIILSKISGDTLDKYLKNNNRCDIEETLALCFNFLFNNGIYNFDMNLTNIIINEDSEKISFIDFDKMMINKNSKNLKKYSSLVLKKFKDSINKYDLSEKFNWDYFYKIVNS